MRLISTFLAIALGLAGCANPSIVSVKSTAIEKISISKIYIPRFEGNPDFVEESTDYFISKLEPKISATIIQGSALRTESTDIASGGNLAPSELAISKANGAQLSQLRVTPAVDELVACAPKDHAVLIQAFNITAREIRYIEPHTFLFSGFNHEGHHTAVVAHYSQVVAHIVYLPKQGSERVITGFSRQREENG